MAAKTFLDLLIESNDIPEDVLDKAIKTASSTSSTLFESLLNSPEIDEIALLKIVSKTTKIHFDQIDKATLDYRTSLLVPESFSREHMILPLFQVGETITIAFSNPFNENTIEELEKMTKMLINPILAPRENISSLMTYCYSFRETIDQPGINSMTSLFELGMKLVEESSAIDEENYDLAHEAPIAKLVDSILVQAIAEKASDIHIEPEEDHLKIRFRIDGILKDIMSPPKKLESPIISRLKILANLDITETRKPQDGRITFVVKEKDIDFRVSTVRTINGEKMVLRILDKSGAFVSMEKLGMNEKDFKHVESLIYSSSGIIIVCGPTGSGKTSTLYSALSKINTPEKNIITIEDPVEFNIEGINQIPANPKIGVDFATALSAVVRQDPDVIMIGEIRDFETANIAIQAALTGHLVFTTLHTRSAAGAISRLLDMGTKPFLLNSAIIGIIGQRLARSICPNCKTEIDISTFKGLKQRELIKDIEKKLGKEEFRVFKGQGCKFCDNTGYKGRIGIFEILVPNDPIKELIMNKESTEKIEESAIQEGMKTMMMDGIYKVTHGITTLDELTRILDI